MKIIQAHISIDWLETELQILQRLERYGRTAYKSEAKINRDSAEAFVKMIIKKGHLSVLEHVSVSARVTTDRGVSHEIVRHRIGVSYTQESTRYCNYGELGELTFILPTFLKGKSSTDPIYQLWLSSAEGSAQTYLRMLALGATPQEARSVLINSLKTEIVMTYNLRAWKHFFDLRTSLAAHPDMQDIAGQLLWEFKRHIPSIF